MHPILLMSSNQSKLSASLFRIFTVIALKHAENRSTILFSKLRIFDLKGADFLLVVGPIDIGAFGVEPGTAGDLVRLVLMVSIIVGLCVDGEFDPGCSSTGQRKDEFEV